MLHISIVTLFPELFTSPFSQSIIKRAIDKKNVSLEYVNLRDFSTDSYKSVDDHPYGGGHGMILRVDIIDRALQKTKTDPDVRRDDTKTHVILLDPQGEPYKQAKAKELSTFNHLILICGHYEGIDERVRALVDEELSIGDYILTGGEIPAMVVVDSVVRLLPQTLKKREATVDESFTENSLEYPQYTRPETYKNLHVPEILLRGNHQKIDQWRKDKARERTKIRRPDLLRGE
jgi:tRNA (guanine37-N1)-methyltransferase